MHVSWLDIGFVVLFALVLKWDIVRATNNATEKLTDRLKNIEFSQERIEEKLLLIESEGTQILNTLHRKQETIEEQWLRGKLYATRLSSDKPNHEEPPLWQR
jgi:hypothetical protein